MKLFDAVMKSLQLPRYSASVRGDLLRYLILGSSSTSSHFAQKALPRQCDTDVTSDMERLEPH